MAKLIMIFLFAGLVSCGETNNEAGSNGPTAIDTTTRHPDGTINGSVISTDTAAMRVVDSTKN